MTTGKKIVYAFLAGIVPVVLYAYASGPDPGYSGAPPDGNPNACASAGCHTGLTKGGPINAAGGSVSATFSSSTYTPGGPPITITVSVSDSANVWHGFQMTARLDSNLASQAGRFSYQTGTSVFVLCSNNIPRSLSGNCAANFPVEFIEHTQPSTGSWSFTWTPPATNQGSVHFYIAGNAVNHNGVQDAGDHVYTASYVLQPAAACI
ncbi:MAG TPA: choice-of-anchor V domain-containing protein, partial [Bryobacteraceae bacterium]|nr:choice-of-anchor V domain-containing protein [Bryobacteraceae bacterium]